MSLNLAWILHNSANRWPQQIAIQFGDREVTYAQLHDEATRFASALTGLGLEPGDRVAMMIPNRPAFTATYFGILHAGGVVVPLNTLFVAGEIAYHLEDSGARTLVVWEEYLDRARDAVSQLDPAPRLVVVSGFEGKVFSEASSYSDLIRDSRPTDEMWRSRPDDPAVLLYTSGTTGRPKGAELSHFNLWSNTQWNADRALSIPPDRMRIVRPGFKALLALPLFHSYGQTCVQNSMLFGGATVVPMLRWDPDEALRMMDTLGCTHFSGVPTMYFGMLQSPELRRRAPSRLEFCGSGGAPLPVEVLQEFEEIVPLRIMEGYGLSETSPVATFHTPGIERKPGSVGIAIDGCEVRIHDDSDRPLPPGELGEIVIRGHNVMRGYWRRPEATAEALRGGWFHSGDLGRMDEQGYVYIVDRKKDMIIRGGFNVYPREIEEVLYAHPAVREAAVIGVPDPRHGEEVVAVVTLREDSEVTEQEIIDFCRPKMAAYKYPRRVAIREALPRGGTGKILKRAIRDELIGRCDSQPTE